MYAPFTISEGRIGLGVESVVEQSFAGGVVAGVCGWIVWEVMGGVLVGGVTVLVGDMTVPVGGVTVLVGDVTVPVGDVTVLACTTSPLN